MANPMMAQYRDTVQHRASALMCRGDLILWLELNGDEEVYWAFRTLEFTPPQTDDDWRSFHHNASRCSRIVRRVDALPDPGLTPEQQMRVTSLRYLRQRWDDLGLESWWDQFPRQDILPAARRLRSAMNDIITADRLGDVSSDLTTVEAWITGQLLKRRRFISTPSPGPSNPYKRRAKRGQPARA